MFPDPSLNSRRTKRVSEFPRKLEDNQDHLCTCARIRTRKKGSFSSGKHLFSNRNGIIEFRRAAERSAFPFRLGFSAVSMWRR